MAAARQSLFRADYDKALRTLGAIEPRNARDAVEKGLLSARLLLRLGRPADAESAINALGRAAANVDERTTCAMLLGIAQVHRGDPAGERLMQDAAEEGRRAHPTVRAELAYHRALARWIARDLDAAEELLDSALAEGADVVQARSLDLMGWIEMARERYSVAGRHFVDGLGALDASKNRDLYLAAGLLQGATIVALETLDLALWRSLKPRLAFDDWGPHTCRRQFHIRQNSALLCLLEGDRVNAWSAFVAAEALADAPARRASIAVDRAFFASLLGERFSRDRYLDVAYGELRKERWSSADAEDRTTLFEFVREAATDRPEQAREAWTRYRSTRGRKNDMLAFDDDRRIAVFERYASGRLSLAMGNVVEGRRELTRAMDEFGRLGYRFREACAALDLFTSSRADRALSVARRAVRSVPKSWLAAAVRAHGDADSGLSALTPAERRVLDHVCEARSNREIAQALGISPHTVNNHLRKIYAALGVRTRAAVAVRCASLRR